MSKRKCAICGSLFTAARGNQRCCSPECAKKRKKFTDKRVTLVHINCAHCGKLFLPVRRDTTCCSRVCSDARKYVLAKEKYVYEISFANCKACGSLFTRRGPDGPRARKVCSKACEVSLRKERERFSEGRPQIETYIMPFDFCNLSTNTYEYRSFDCPEFDPMTNRMWSV